MKEEYKIQQKNILQAYFGQSKQRAFFALFGMG